MKSTPDRNCNIVALCNPLSEVENILTCERATNHITNVQKILNMDNNTRHPEATISGWVARDRNGSVSLYQSYPERQENLGYWRDGSDEFGMADTDFPSLTWQDEPIEVEITIKPKKS